MSWRAVLASGTIVYVAMIRDKSWGFTLIEILVVTGLVVVLLGATVYSLKPGSAKASTASLAKAISAELQNARQLAIASGHLVAMGFSRKGSGVANSIYRLEGWNVPRITWSLSYAGDYPSLGFAVVKWGADFIEGNKNPPLSKFSLLDPVSGKAPIFGAFSIDDWIPSELAGDAIVCFTPDGGVATSKGLYSLNGRYALVVAKYLGVDDSGVIRSGSEPFAVYISESGAISVSKDMPGLDISAGLPSETSKARLAKELAEDKEAVTLISDITVLPDSQEDGDDVDGFCTPGEQVTFLVYAQDALGRQLFTRWKQTGPSGLEEKVGRFTVS